MSRFARSYSLHWCSKCNKQIDEYESMKYDGLCECCYYCY